MRRRWELSALGDVCNVIGGGTPSKRNPDFYEGNISWATVRDMKNEVLSHTEFHISQDAIKSSSTNLIPAHNVVIATRVGLGKVCLLKQDTAINQDLRGIIPKSNNLDVRFLFRWLQSVADIIEGEGTGATVKGVKLPFVKSLQLPLPPLPEQERIVAILDEAFAGIATAVANTQKNLANARELFETIVVSGIFGDPDQKGWESAGVEALASDRKGAIRTGPFGSQLLHGEFCDAGVAVLGIDNAVKNEFAWGKRRFISEQKYQQLKRYTVRPRDVIITIMGTCGRCAVVPDNIPLAVNTKHLCCITLNKERCLPEFLHCYFLYHPVAREYLDKQAKGSIMAGLNMGIVKSLPVRLPGLEEQAEVVRKIEDLKSQISTIESVYERKLTALADLRQSLLQKAFSGELTAGKGAPTAILKEEEVA